NNQAEYYINPANFCCILLFYYLSIFSLVSKLLRLNSHVAIFLLIFLFCYEASAYLRASCGVCLTTANNEILQDYVESLIPVYGTMQLWISHENKTLRWGMIVNELTWFWIAVVIGLLYLCLTLSLTYFKKHTRHERVNPSLTERLDQTEFPFEEKNQSTV